MSYLKLIVTATQRVIEVRESVVRLGRDPASTIAFGGDDGRVVSAHHAELRHAAAGWRLVDLGSRNGTYLNGTRLSGDAPGFVLSVPIKHAIPLLPPELRQRLGIP